MHLPLKNLLNLFTQRKLSHTSILTVIHARFLLRNDGSILILRCSVSLPARHETPDLQAAAATNQCLQGLGSAACECLAATDRTVLFFRALLLMAVKDRETTTQASLQQ